MIVRTSNFCDVPARTEDARVLFLSDVHLLHRRTPTHVIIDNFWEVVTPKVMSNIDALYIAGDLWDDSRQLRQDDTVTAIAFLSELLVAAKKYDFGLRVLEGTPSHDHGQSKVIELLNKNINADAVYLDDIGIWKDERIDKVVGYVRDEYKTTARETQKEMREMMKTRGIDQVDFFVMHGCFTFQLPVFSERSFNEHFWEKRAKYGIFIGHDHHPKTYGKIRVTGSFDRLSSNEEELKGATLCDFTASGAVCWFIPNHGAVPYMQVKGIKNEKKIYAKALEALKYVEDHPNGRHGQVSIEYPHDSDIAESVRRWSKEYSFLVKGVKLPDPQKAADLEMAFEEGDKYETITAENVAGLLFDEIGESEIDKDIALDILKMVA